MLPSRSPPWRNSWSLGWNSVILKRKPLDVVWPSCLPVGHLSYSSSFILKCALLNVLWMSSCTSVVLRSSSTSFNQVPFSLWFTSSDQMFLQNSVLLLDLVTQCPPARLCVGSQSSFWFVLNRGFCLNWSHLSTYHLILIFCFDIVFENFWDMQSSLTI